MSLATRSNPDFGIIRRKKVYEEVARQIERLILKKLKPGDKLPAERELASILEVSRGSIRDAIRSLELVGPGGTAPRYRDNRPRYARRVFG